MKYTVIEKQKWQVKMGRYPEGSKDRSGKPFAMVRPLDRNWRWKTYQPLDYPGVPQEVRDFLGYDGSSYSGIDELEQGVFSDDLEVNWTHWLKRPAGEDEKGGVRVGIIEINVPVEKEVDLTPTDSQKARIDELTEKLSRLKHKLETVPVRPFDEVWDASAGYFTDDPSQPFEGGEEEASEWVPSRDPDLDEYDASGNLVVPGYKKYAYALMFGRDEDGRYIKVGTVDTDGDWDYDTHYEDEPTWDYFYRNNVLWAAQGAADWAEYCLDCAAYDCDPLGEYVNPGEVTVDRILQDAEHNLGYLEKLTRQAKEHVCG